MSDFDSFVDSLDSDIDNVPTKADTKVTYPCGQCQGSGLWQGGRTNYRGNNKCLACKGTGYFKTDPRTRQKARDAKAARKRKVRSDELALFKAENPVMFKELERAYSLQTGNDFVLSLANQLWSRGFLSQKQIDAWQRGHDRLASIRAAEAAAPAVDLAPLRAMFETAAQNGYAKPTYRAEGLIISRAPASGANPGALYVKTVDKAYLGKVVGTRYSGQASAREPLAAIAKDPLAAAVRYGQKTGRCSCCGRELTNHASIAAGIGPICADKWGL